MVNTIHILDHNNNIIRLIKRYDITLLNIFPTVLDTLIREYVDDIINIHVINRKYSLKMSYDINVTNQYINCIPISFSFSVSFHSHISDLQTTYNNISNNIVKNVNPEIYEYDYYWCGISNLYMKCMYNQPKHHSNIYTRHVTYNANICKYYFDRAMFEICNHKLFKNVIIIMQILTKHLQKKLIS